MVWLMDGATITSYGVSGNMPLSWTVAGVADFNGDAKADILWRNTSGDVAMWLMNGTTRHQQYGHRQHLDRVDDCRHRRLRR